MEPPVAPLRAGRPAGGGGVRLAESGGRARYRKVPHGPDGTVWYRTCQGRRARRRPRGRGDPVPARSLNVSKMASRPSTNRFGIDTFMSLPNAFFNSGYGPV